MLKRRYKPAGVIRRKQFLVRKAAKLKANPTAAELGMMRLLNSLKVKYLFQNIRYKNGVCRIFDFFLPCHRIVIEVDGLYHDAERDKVRDLEVLAQHPHLKIYRFTNKQVLIDWHETREKLKLILFP